MGQFWLGMFVGIMFISYISPFFNTILEVIMSKAEVIKSKYQVEIQMMATKLEKDLASKDGVAVGFHHCPEEEIYEE